MIVFLAFAFQREYDTAGNWVILITVVFLVFMLARSVYRRVRLQLVPRKWKKTEAIVQQGFGAVVIVPDLYLGSHYFWKPALHYTYQVEKETCSGYFTLDRTFDSPEQTRGAAREWLNQKIVIRYNPANPQESVFFLQDGAPPGSEHLRNDVPPSNLVPLSLK